MKEFIITIKGKDYVSDDETELGEPSLTLELSDSTSIEITHEEDGLDTKDQFFSVRHHCSEEDFDNDIYHATLGVIDQYVVDTEEEVEDLIEFLIKDVIIER